jgi:hypothetical protein
MRPAEIENTIQRAYEARLQQNPSGRPLGWRLLYSPRSVLEGVRAAFIGLNPSGSTADPDHGVFSSKYVGWSRFIAVEPTSEGGAWRIILEQTSSDFLFNREYAGRCAPTS